jgi:pilus assembly protein CpaC
MSLMLATSNTAPCQTQSQKQGAPVFPDAQTLHVLVGKSVVVNVESCLKRILASNPTVVEALAMNPNQVVVEAKAPGTSSLILWYESGQSRMLDVIVDLDVSGLRTAIDQAYPNQQLQVQAESGRIILAGSVPDQQDVDRLLKMASAYSNQVVNSLTVAGARERQVLLEVKFAEVDRTRLEQLGINFFSTGAGNTIGTISTQQFGAQSLESGKVTGNTPGHTATSLVLSDLLNIFLFRPDINLGATIKDLQENNVLQILAEPNLLALDGKKASFLAGGEFPFPVVQGGVNVGAVTIQFRPFGVRLDFTGHINEDGAIRLVVSPEVSALDFTNALTISGFTVPAISTRRAETEIELRDGQSFGIAGLLDQRAQAQLSKLPGIADLPVLGHLFRSKGVNRSNTELLVLVTPHIADPVKMGAAVAAQPKPAIPFLETPKFDQKLPMRKELEQQANPGRQN